MIATKYKNYIKQYGQLSAIVRDWRENINRYTTPTGSYVITQDVNEYIKRNLDRIIAAVHEDDSFNKDFVEKHLTEFTQYRKEIREEVLAEIKGSIAFKFGARTDKKIRAVLDDVMSK